MQILECLDAATRRWKAGAVRFEGAESADIGGPKPQTG
jgi:hypothetical protein